MSNNPIVESVAEHRLPESERQFHTLANSIPQLAWMADCEGYIFWYNDRWYDYTGTTLEEMQGWGWQRGATIRTRSTASSNASRSP